MNQYPKWLYHKDEKPKIVQTQAEQKELGAGWMESPADHQTTQLRTQSEHESLIEKIEDEMEAALHIPRKRGRPAKKD